MDSKKGKRYTISHRIGGKNRFWFQFSSYFTIELHLFYVVILLFSAVQIIRILTQDSWMIPRLENQNARIEKGRPTLDRG